MEKEVQYNSAERGNLSIHHQINKLCQFDVELNINETTYAQVAYPAFSFMKIAIFILA